MGSWCGQRLFWNSSVRAERDGKRLTTIVKNTIKIEVVVSDGRELEPSYENQLALGASWRHPIVRSRSGARAAAWESLRLTSDAPAAKRASCSKIPRRRACHRRRTIPAPHRGGPHSPRLRLGLLEATRRLVFMREQDDAEDTHFRRSPAAPGRKSPRSAGPPTFAFRRGLGSLRSSSLTCESILSHDFFGKARPRRCRRPRHRRIGRGPPARRVGRPHHPPGRAADPCGAGGLPRPGPRPGPAAAGRPGVDRHRHRLPRLVDLGRCAACRRPRAGEVNDGGTAGERKGRGHRQQGALG